MHEKSEYLKYLKEAVSEYGGLFNAHLHLDRASTLDKKYLSHIGMNPIEASGYSLAVKQNLVGDLHRGPAYEKADLTERMQNQLEALIELNTKRADSFIDVSPDIGLTAFEIALSLKEKYQDKIDFRIGAYPIFGLKDNTPNRWELFMEAAKQADYLGCLPERDDANKHQNHIGIDEHFRRTLKLAIELKKPVHYHVDQANDQRENLTETLVQAVRWLGQPKVESENPSVWAVHVISPSAYEEQRFNSLLDGLLEQNIGVICCPTAAISMRQLRPLTAPTHNSTARVLEMLAKKIPVRIGSDNIADVFLPSTTASLYDEILVLSNAIRFYNPDIFAKVACGKSLTDVDRELIAKSLENDQNVFKKL